MRVRLRRLESIYTIGHYLCWIRSASCGALCCNDYCRSSSVNTMLSNLGWQDLETRRKINDLTMFFKITTGNVRISFSNDLREVHCPYLTRGSLQQPFQFQRYSSTINAHKYSFFVRTVPAWNALSPVSVRADSVAVFHSSIWNVKDYLSFLSSDISKLLRVISRAVKPGSHMPPMYLRRSRRYHLGYFSHEWEYAPPTTRAIAVVYRRHACEVELESNSQACRR